MCVLPSKTKYLCPICKDYNGQSRIQVIRHALGQAYPRARYVCSTCKKKTTKGHSSEFTRPAHKCFAYEVGVDQLTFEEIRTLLVHSSELGITKPMVEKERDYWRALEPYTPVRRLGKKPETPSPERTTEQTIVVNQARIEPEDDWETAPELPNGVEHFLDGNAPDAEPAAKKLKLPPIETLFQTLDTTQLTEAYDPANPGMDRAAVRGNMELSPKEDAIYRQLLLSCPVPTPQVTEDGMVGNDVPQPAAEGACRDDASLPEDSGTEWRGSTVTNQSDVQIPKPTHYTDTLRPLLKDTRSGFSYFVPDSDTQLGMLPNRRKIMAVPSWHSDCQVRPMIITEALNDNEDNIFRQVPNLMPYVNRVPADLIDQCDVYTHFKMVVCGTLLVPKGTSLDGIKWS